MTAWATPVEASIITNKAVSQEDLESAMSVIDLYSNASIEASGNVGARNLRWLKVAVSWQAVWQAARVEYGVNMDVDQVTQDGHTFWKGYEDAHLLAPLARRALFKLSWSKTRTIDPLSPDEAVGLKYGGGGLDWGGPRSGVSGDEEWLDNQHGWEPM
jgi:hypothetical protein